MTDIELLDDFIIEFDDIMTICMDIIIKEKKSILISEIFDFVYDEVVSNEILQKNKIKTYLKKYGSIFYGKRPLYAIIRGKKLEASLFNNIKKLALINLSANKTLKEYFYNVM